MEKSTGSLAEALGIGEREHLAFVGGGGKTTLILTLAEELRKKKRSVVLSTTTKVRQGEIEVLPSILLTQSEPSWKNRFRDELEMKGLLFLAERRLESGKLKGIHPILADELFMDEAIDYLLVEADGAAGRPVKAPADFEPVIPDSATRVVALVGLEALGQGVTEQIVFRMDLFRQLTGIKPEQPLTPAGIMKLMGHPDGLYKSTPRYARKVAFLNKLDLLEDKKAAKDLAERLAGNKDSGIERVLFGSLRKGEYYIAGKHNEGHLPQDF